jgi:uncharacterized cupin superfamily protein
VPWFVVNVADAPALRHERGGSFVRFEDPDDRFPEFGVNIHVLAPGQPNAKYHREEAQEDFLVLSGECLLIVEGQERRLRAWDFVHCPAGTEHVFVGAGDGPCAILMIGTRGAGRAVHYPVNALAARHGASVVAPTDSPAEAYADWGREFTPTRLDWPPAGG